MPFLIISLLIIEGNMMNAQQSLEVGLSYNFEVRDHPIYHLINAKVMKTNGNMEDAIKTLQVALNLVHKRKKGSAGAGNKVSLCLQMEV